MNKDYKPPYKITDKIINYISVITEVITKLTINNEELSSPMLRRENQIKTIHSSLAIENNSLSLDQVTDIINGKRVLGPPQEITEVKNAFETYEMILNFDPLSSEDLLKAHKILMKDLVNDNGQFRKGGVGVFAGEKLIHMAPQAKFVPDHMSDLFRWASENTDIHPLIRSCVFHYEFEFIHPFSDGNGRMGRLWQTLHLSRWRKVFRWLPVETLVKERQQEYYDVLGVCDNEAESTKFIEYMLHNIYESLLDIKQTEQVAEQVTEQVEKLMNVISSTPKSANELMELVGIKHKLTFRDNYLKPAVKLGLVLMTVPDKPRSSKQKYYKK
ncbi:MAG: Fic family protein [Tenericutes bacterium]|nr:Fic family protein [Mycoplasmatota bacterium]